MLMVHLCRWGDATILLQQTPDSELTEEGGACFDFGLDNVKSVIERHTPSPPKISTSPPGKDGWLITALQELSQQYRDLSFQRYPSSSGTRETVAAPALPSVKKWTSRLEGTEMQHKLGELQSTDAWEIITHPRANR